jgi:hypothetical protein
VDRKQSPDPKSFLSAMDLRPADATTLSFLLCLANALFALCSFPGLLQVHFFLNLFFNIIYFFLFIHGDFLLIFFAPLDRGKHFQDYDTRAMASTMHGDTDWLFWEW